MHPEQLNVQRAINDLRGSLDSQIVDTLQDRLTALMATVLVPTGERYRHEKRGTTYDIYGFGHANSANEVFVEDDSIERSSSQKVIFDRDEVVIYRDVQSGHIGIRTVKEFADGRFTLLPQRTGRPPVDHAQTVAAALGLPAPVQAPTAAPEAVEKPESKRVKFRQHGHMMHDKTGTVIEWLDEGKVRVHFDGNDHPVVVPTLNIAPAGEDEAVQS